MRFIADPHFAAAFIASKASCELLEVMPQSDLVDQLSNMLIEQLSILYHMVENRHYGSDSLDSFIKYCEEVREEARRIKESYKEDK